MILGICFLRGKTVASFRKQGGRDGFVFSSCAFKLGQFFIVLLSMFQESCVKENVQ